MMKDLDYLPNTPNTGGWQNRHKAAIRRALAGTYPREPGDTIVRGIRAWLEYATAHAARFQSKIGEDYFLGPAWATWGAALRVLLNGETGNLDCGTLDTILHDNLAEQGYDPEGVER